MQKYKVRVPYECQYYREVVVLATNEADAEQIVFDMQVEGKLDNVEQHITYEEAILDKMEVERK